MATAAATPQARPGSGISRPAQTPTVAASALPPTIDQGCASGLLGTPNSSTAEAPIGAINHRFTSPKIKWLIQPASISPKPAPTLEISISRLPTASGCGHRRAHPTFTRSIHCVFMLPNTAQFTCWQQIYHIILKELTAPETAPPKNFC